MLDIAALQSASCPVNSYQSGAGRMCHTEAAPWARFERTVALGGHPCGYPRFAQPWLISNTAHGHPSLLECCKTYIRPLTERTTRPAANLPLLSCRLCSDLRQPLSSQPRFASLSVTTAAARLAASVVRQVHRTSLGGDEVQVRAGPARTGAW
jgi:hypothetical protein